MIDTVSAVSDTLSLIGVTSAGGMAGATTVVTRTALANSEGPRGEPGALDAAERKELAKPGSERLASPLDLDPPETTTYLVMRGNAAFSVTAGSDKRTLAPLWRSRVSRDVYAKEHTR